MSDEFLNEVQEDLRQQKLKEFWRENGNWIIGGALLAVVMTAGLSFWRSHEATVNVRETKELIKAMDTFDTEKMAAFSKETDRKHALLARFAEAKTYMERQQYDKAADAYDQASRMMGVDGTWKDLAKLYSINLRLDKGDPAKLHEELETLTGKNDPWRFSAREMQAVLYAREKKMNEAVSTLEDILSDPQAPVELRQRAASLRGLYQAEAAGQPTIKDKKS